MSSEKKQPKWWQLYLMLPALVGLFWPEIRAPFTRTEHILAELGILLLILGAVQLWLRANRSALIYSDPAEPGWGLHLYEIPFEQLRQMEEQQEQEERDRARPPSALRLPAIHGVLENTFERSTPEDEASVFMERRAELRKE